MIVKIEVNLRHKSKKIKVTMKTQKYLKIKKARNQITQARLMRQMRTKTKMFKTKKNKVNLHLMMSLRKRQNIR